MGGVIAVLSKEVGGAGVVLQQLAVRPAGQLFPMASSVLRLCRSRVYVPTSPFPREISGHPRNQPSPPNLSFGGSETRPGNASDGYLAQISPAAHFSLRCTYYRTPQATAAEPSAHVPSSALAEIATSALRPSRSLLRRSQSGRSTTPSFLRQCTARVGQSA